MISNNVSNSFSNLLKSVNTTPAELSHKSGISVYNISSYCSGEYTPSARNMQKLSKSLGIPVAHLMSAFNEMPTQMTFGTTVKVMRYQKGISEQSLGRRTNSTQQRIYMIEQSPNIPTTTTIVKLAHGLGVKPSTLWKRFSQMSGHSLDWNDKLEELILDRHMTNSQASRACHIGFSKFKALVTGKSYPTPRNLILIGMGLNVDDFSLFKQSVYNENYTKTFGYWLLKKECQSGWSSHQIVKKLGCSRQTLSNYIRNVHTPNKLSESKIKEILKK